MSVSCKLVEGWTERIISQVRATPPKSFVGCTVELKLRTNAGALVSLGGSVNWVDATEGTVYFDPASTDLTAANSPYGVRWKVTDAANKVSFFPNEEEREVWEVAPV